MNERHARRLLDSYKRWTGNELLHINPTLPLLKQLDEADQVILSQRTAFLEKVSTDGYVDNYTGIRISATGKRFFIVDAVVWNIVDENGQYIGQAATFRHVRPIAG